MRATLGGSAAPVGDSIAGSRADRGRDSTDARNHFRPPPKLKKIAVVN
jgi:hypothetical protein